MSRANFLVLIAVFFSTFVFSLDKAVSGISPEYKEAAQKRQAEIARQMFCMKRDFASFVLACMAEIGKAERAINK